MFVNLSLVGIALRAGFRKILSIVLIVTISIWIITCGILWATNNPSKLEETITLGTFVPSVKFIPHGNFMTASEIVEKMINKHNVEAIVLREFYATASEVNESNCLAQVSDLPDSDVPVVFGCSNKKTNQAMVYRNSKIEEGVYTKYRNLFIHGERPYDQTPLKVHHFPNGENNAIFSLQTCKSIIYITSTQWRREAAPSRRLNKFS